MSLLFFLCKMVWATLINHAVILLLSYGIIRTELHPIKNSRRSIFFAQHHHFSLLTKKSSPGLLFQIHPNRLHAS